MKLSVRKKFGFIHCRGGRLLKVTKEHAVPSSGLSVDEKQPVADPWIFAKVGDLAIEIIAVKTGKLLGHSYLSGPAIRCNRYTPAQEDWFGPAKGRLLELPPAPEGVDRKEWDAFIAQLADILIPARFGDDDIVAFEYETPNMDECKAAAELFVTSGNYVQTLNGEDMLSKTDLVGLVLAGRKGKQGIHLVHIQVRAQEHCVTVFQVNLVLSGLRSQDQRH